MTDRAPLIEIFTSVQGEGRHVGALMTFVRAAVCPIRCLYCDTPNSYTAPATFPVRGCGEACSERNPVTGARAAELVARSSALALPVSLTGGEPLLYPEFVRSLGARLRAAGRRLHLETAALDAEALAVCVDRIDHLSADYKLPGTLEAGDFRAQHRACIAIAATHGLSIDVKLVLTPAVGEAEVHAALADLAEVRTRILLVLQPVTPFGRVRATVAGSAAAGLAAAAQARGFDVRVLPQAHKVLGVE